MGIVNYWNIILPRVQIYGLSLYSVYDSLGLGFGIGGDSYYMEMIDNYDITHGLTNAHSYLFQMVLTSGIVVFLFYCIIIAAVMHGAAKQARDLFWLMPILYLLLLFSPSSSLMLWTHYPFLCAFVCHASGIRNEELGIRN